MTTLAFPFSKLVVADLDRSERFYSGVFGMKRTNHVRSDEHQYALEETMLSLTGDTGAHILILTRYLRRPTPPAGSAWTGFLVADIDETLASLRSHGGSVEVPVHDNAEFATRAAIAADPDGHLIEIVQKMEE